MSSNSNTCVFSYLVETEPHHSFSFPCRLGFCWRAGETTCFSVWIPGPFHNSLFSCKGQRGLDRNNHTKMASEPLSPRKLVPSGEGPAGENKHMTALSIMFKWEHGYSLGCRCERCSSVPVIWWGPGAEHPRRSGGEQATDGFLLWSAAMATLETSGHFDSLTASPALHCHRTGWKSPTCSLVITAMNFNSFLRSQVGENHGLSICGELQGNMSSWGW